MPDYPIDLGKSSSLPMAVEADFNPSEMKHYPCLYMDWDDQYDLPESGVMTVRFRKKSETNRESDHGVSQSVELEIREIVDVEPDKKKRKRGHEEGSEALDKYKKELE